MTYTRERKLLTNEEIDKIIENMNLVIYLRGYNAYGSVDAHIYCRDMTYNEDEFMSIKIQFIPESAIKEMNDVLVRSIKDSLYVLNMNDGRKDRHFVDGVINASEYYLDSQIDAILDKYGMRSQCINIRCNGYLTIYTKLREIVAEWEMRYYNNDNIGKRYVPVYPDFGTSWLVYDEEYEKFCHVPNMTTDGMTRKETDKICDNMNGNYNE